MEAATVKTELELAQLDEQIAIKVLGGFGVRNHLGDTDYALKVNEMLFKLAGVNAENVECVICLVKTRNIVDLHTPESDTFNLIGGVSGQELELTALHAIIAAKIRQYRIWQQQQGDNNVVDDKADNGEGVQDNQRN